jgi:hypothetical protein
MSEDSRKDLPPVTSPNFLEKVREALGVYLGNRGDALDRGVTLRDLTDSGMVTLRPGYNGSGSKTRTPILGVGTAVVTTPYEPDLTPPPTPTGFTVTPAITSLFVECDSQIYAQGHGHAKSVVYGATWVSGALPVFANAVVIDEFTGTVVSSATNPATTWHLWLKWVTVDGVYSVVPAGGTNGVVATTGQDVSKLLTALNGAITSSQLYAALGTRINLIDDSSATAGSVNARVLAEATARATALANEATARATALSNEATARATALANEATARGAAISSEATIRQTADTSLASDITTITASVNGNASAIQTEATARATADSAEATARQTLAARVTNTETGLTAAQASITTESSTRASADSATASQISALTSTVGANTSAITTEATARASADSAIASQITALTSTVGANTSAITTEATARASADSAIASQITALTSTVGANTSAITTEATTRASADSATASQISALTSTVGANTSAITTEATARASADSAIASQITALTSTVGANTSAITTEATTRASADSATASQISALTSTVGANTSAITTEATTRASADSAITGQITTLSATAGANTSAIQTEATTRASQTGDLFAKYTVKLDVNGYVSGFGLASTANNAAPFSSFIVRADNFAIAAPTGPGISPLTPFTVTTTTQTIDGVSVPPGVYIDGGYIKGGSIDGSKITGGTITGSKLISVSADKITGAALLNTSYIESASFVTGTSGWKIFGNGTAEFAAASIRGQLSAGQINTNGLIIRDAGGTPIFGSGYPLSYTSITGTPTLGPLATSSTIPYSSVTGTPTLGALATQATVNWNTQITNIPGFGGFAFLSTITSANIGTFMGPTAITNAYIADAAITSAKILDGEVTNAKIGGAIQSTNYLSFATYGAYAAGWRIDKAGTAEFNDITVRSGQVTGALMTAFKVNSYSGLYVDISYGSPVSTTNGPYYLNGAGEPLYLVYQGVMPAPATAPHKIAIALNVQAIAGASQKDLGVKLFVDANFTGGSNVTASESIAYNTDSGTFAISTNAAGVTTSTYAAATTCMVFVTGYNAGYTVQSIDGLAWGVR